LPFYPPSCFWNDIKASILSNQATIPLKKMHLSHAVKLKLEYFNVRSLGFWNLVFYLDKHKLLFNIVHMSKELIEWNKHIMRKKWTEIINKLMQFQKPQTTRFYITNRVTNFDFFLGYIEKAKGHTVKSSVIFFSWICIKMWVLHILMCLGRVWRQIHGGNCLSRDWSVGEKHYKNLNVIC
jgi:hypothetical protein